MNPLVMVWNGICQHPAIMELPINHQYVAC